MTQRCSGGRDTPLLRAEVPPHHQVWHHQVWSLKTLARREQLPIDGDIPRGSHSWLISHPLVFPRAASGACSKVTEIYLKVKVPGQVQGRPSSTCGYCPPAGVQTSPAFLPEHTRMGPSGPTTLQYIAITVVVSCLGLKACFYLSSFSIPG